MEKIALDLDQKEDQSLFQTRIEKVKKHIWKPFRIKTVV